jgi:putative sigma-54 modulation protein
MRINTVGRHFEITDAIREYAEQKVAKLPKYFDGVQQITVTIGKSGSHGLPEFDVELIVDVEKHKEFVSHAKTPDPYEAIDLVVDKGERQLRDFKERLKG